MSAQNDGQGGVVEWVKRLLDKLFRRPKPPPLQQQSQSDSHGPEPRYDVQNTQGGSAAKTDSLSEAQVEWMRQTNKQGRIIDTQTGEDVTPEPDDDGRYVVFDKQGNQLASFSDRNKALNHWRQATREAGKVIDTKTGEDITAELKGYLDEEQLQQAIDSMQGYGRGDMLHTELGIDPEQVESLMKQLNQMKIPIFDVTNIVGTKGHKPTKTVSVKRRRMKIEQVKRIVEIDEPTEPLPSGRIVVPYPTDQPEQRPIRSTSDITRVRARQLAVPRQLLGRRIAKRELSMTTFEEEVPGAPKTRKRKVWRTFDEPKVEEWNEEVEVSDEPRAQLLEIVVDVSGSMWGFPLNVAMALASLLVGKHLDDGSRYYYRQFAEIVGELRKAENEKEKRELIHFFVTQSEDEVGSGTDILQAVITAARDVRHKAKSDDRPEVLLLTDGDAPLTAEDVYDAIGEDVTLHAVVIYDWDNESLKEHASTYYRLYYDGYQLHGSN